MYTRQKSTNELRTHYSSGRDRMRHHHWWTVSLLS